ncbi:hypothetical protein EPA93_33080 [Ktedonosporobacter rubrisoli]|uniref:Methylamine utilisation protein MauE domain-containing protein n=1 Tax=Ktedonosporobacter rubrisoli TaxID=2509675 RepID=A0A4P6JZK2_KTERU|nr:MauE/DoxX family redox-associated membrane protein [Ktedonosporobacter rubrisoli]QBD80546.1 hypothetical protein EPA93_33080 [Ktedonosporobacter rubrisoli]
MASYVLAFCRMAVGLLFLISFLGKMREPAKFRQTITDFRILPVGLSQMAAFLFLGAELVTVLCMLLGDVLLLPGFLLASLLLLVFSGALAIVLMRGQRTACNCFGNNTKPIELTDLFRNAGLLLCAAGGCGIQSWLNQTLQPLGWLQWLPVTLRATIFVLLWTQLGDLLQLFRQI